MLLAKCIKISYDWLVMGVTGKDKMVRFQTMCAFHDSSDVNKAGRYKAKARLTKANALDAKAEAMGAKANAKKFWP